MYYQMMWQCTQILKNLETCLDKAEQHAAAKKFDVGVLMASRLAPDMKDFVYQVQSACDYVKAGAAWLSGQTPPKHEDNEQTIDELRASGWLPVPRLTLPFPSIVAASRNDPLGDYGRVSQLARDWGSRLVDLGEVGHLNPASGFGKWPAAELFINELTK